MTDWESKCRELAGAALAPELTPEDVDRLRANAQTMHTALWRIYMARKSAKVEDMAEIARIALAEVHGEDVDHGNE